MPGDAPTRWLDLEVARRRAVAADPTLAHDSVLHRQPVTTLDDHLARGLRVEALRDLVDGLRAARRRRRRRPRTRADLAFGPPDPAARRRCATSTPSRATSGRCGSAAAARCPRRGTACRSSTSATSRRSAARTSRSGRRRRRSELDYELEVAALVDTPCVDLAAGARRGGDRRLHDLQRLVGSRPPARGDGGPPRVRPRARTSRARSGRGW